MIVLGRAKAANGQSSLWDFPIIRVPYFGVLITRILLFRIPY